jgi:heparin binding hemagglutinin HbhA
MSVATDIRNTLTDTKPLLAYVGTIDLAVEKAREARVEAEARRAKLRAEYTPAKLQAKATELQGKAVELPEKAVKAVQELPTLALNRGIELSELAQAQYADLAVRGEKLVTRIRNQKATKDLVAQVDTTIASAKGAVTVARKGAADVQSSAKALFTTGRKEAVRATDAIVASVNDEVETATTEVKKSAARTRTAAKRTATTTKNATTKVETAAKGTRTGVKKAAAGATKATKTAATKVGS